MALTLFSILKLKEMEKYKVIVNKKGEKEEFLGSLTREEAIDETTRYVDMILKNSESVSYLNKSAALEKTPSIWEIWFEGDGYYKLQDPHPMLILSENEIQKGIDRFSQLSVDVFIEKEELITEEILK